MTDARFRIILREAQDHERDRIIAQHGQLGSDRCVALWLDAQLVGWFDDYGSFHRLPPAARGQLAPAAEELLIAATRFWEEFVA